MAEGYEIFQNVLNYKHQYDLAIHHGRSGLFECRSGSRDFCAPGIVWLMLFIFGFIIFVILPFIVGGGGLAILIYGVYNILKSESFVDDQSPTKIYVLP